MLSDDEIIENIRCHIRSVTALTGAAEQAGAAVHSHCESFGGTLRNSKPHAHVA